MNLREFDKGLDPLNIQAINFIASSLQTAAFAKGRLKRNSSESITRVPIYNTDLAYAGRFIRGKYVTLQGALRKDLKQINLFSNEFLYSSFRPHLLDRLMKTGTYRSKDDKSSKIDKANDDIVFACTVMKPPHVDELGIYETDEKDIFYYMAGNEMDYLFGEEASTYGMIAIYKRAAFKNSDFDNSAYEFKDPKSKLKALTAVVRVLDK